MLLNEFFHITNIQSADKHIVNITLNPAHGIYNGHFPGNPIAPGVCLTQMIKETVEELTNKKLTIVTGDNIKFMAILNPNINPNVILTIALKSNEEGRLAADCMLSGDGTNFFSFKGTMKESN